MTDFAVRFVRFQRTLDGADACRSRFSHEFAGSAKQPWEAELGLDLAADP